MTWAILASSAARENGLPMTCVVASGQPSPRSAGRSYPDMNSTWTPGRSAWIWVRKALAVMPGMTTSVRIRSAGVAGSLSRPSASCPFPAVTTR